jgi:lipopolysaccharide/colanic/teichoic acid biosynthesis glycosyltransferase
MNRAVARLQRLAWRMRTNLLGAFKRVLDVTVALCALLVLSPLLLLVALAIKLHDAGPVLFWQRRVGFRGREFPFPKFRSMVTNAEAVRAALMKRDPRITPIGRLIRRTSIDELPQLWCVLRGDMSLVGPRPPIPPEVARYTMRDRERLLVKPGLTCFWQVEGRSEIPFEQQVEMDIDYIQRQSIGTDLVVLAKTLPAVVRGRGAY